ncbi:hypothetical protein [Paraglaciecola sp. MB-3u-78]|uniref:hypothetical protein n=1 Tax=Paraglaciecola sp. MB-3u-78 TaxID=2058332 RepID=UPI000C32F882|nr:hypothetical protein [Paraglaciecola sp. MB-3u-78]PKG98797.1 hypothetical protein CXF95_13145 [Paraglaciecola sp. MB-3u-78]
MPITKEIRDSDSLVIAITGFRNKLNLPVNEFFEQASLTSASKIVVIDPSFRVGLSGIPPEYPTFFDIIEYLRNQIAEIPHKQLIVTGTSAGAHSAILFGHLLEADQVVSFAPYTYLNRSKMSELKDPSLQTMSRVIDGLELLDDRVKSYFDLMNVVATWNGKTKYYIHVSKYHDWDRRRANYLKGVDSLKVIEHPFSEHSVASRLAKFNRLAQCFEFPYQHKITMKDLYLHLKNSSDGYSTHLHKMIKLILGKGWKAKKAFIKYFKTQS